jgi:hypothetical protein
MLPDAAPGEMMELESILPMVDNAQQRERLLDIWLGLTGQGPLPEGPLIMPVLSGSMRPIMPIGSRILIHPCAASECRRGDVAVHQEGDRLVAHRILVFIGSRRRGWAFLKGDANPHGNWLRCRDIKGKVARVLPAEEAGGQGRDPFSPAAASQNAWRYLRDLVLAGPRYLKKRLFGQRRGEGGSS